MKKILSLFVFTFSLLVCFSQEIDPRLLANKGEQIKEIYKNKRNAYNFYLFALDSSYYVVDIKNLTNEERKSIDKSVVFNDDLKQKINTSAFNYEQLGIQLLKEKRQYFRIDKKSVLVFYKLPEVSEKFTKSSLYTK